MDPHLLLLVFLPTIAFSAGIAQDPHTLRKSWLQIMLLAWPGVVLCFVLIAVCAKYFFPYNWDWVQSLLFGAMVSLLIIHKWRERERERACKPCVAKPQQHSRPPPKHTHTHTHTHTHAKTQQQTR